MRHFYKDPVTGEKYEYDSLEAKEQYGPPSLIAMTSQEISEHLEPTQKTYKQSLDSLNATYQADVAKLNSAFALALLSDGPSEATKIAAIRTQYDARKIKHAADLAALKIEYGV